MEVVSQTNHFNYINDNDIHIRQEKGRPFSSRDVDSNKNFCNRFQAKDSRNQTVILTEKS